jgi:hypothetical protein
VVHPPDDLVKYPVALLLADKDVARKTRALRVMPDHLVKQDCGLDDVRPSLLEQVEEVIAAASEHPLDSEQHVPWNHARAKLHRPSAPNVNEL